MVSKAKLGLSKGTRIQKKEQELSSRSSDSGDIFGVYKKSRSSKKIEKGNEDNIGIATENESKSSADHKAGTHEKLEEQYAGSRIRSDLHESQSRPEKHSKAQKILSKRSDSNQVVDVRFSKSFTTESIKDFEGQKKFEEAYSARSIRSDTHGSQSGPDETTKQQEEMSSESSGSDEVFDVYEKVRSSRKLVSEITEIIDEKEQLQEYHATKSIGSDTYKSQSSKDQVFDNNMASGNKSNDFRNSGKHKDIESSDPLNVSTRTESHRDDELQYISYSQSHMSINYDSDHGTTKRDMEGTQQKDADPNLHIMQSPRSPRSQSANQSSQSVHWENLIPGPI